MNVIDIMKRPAAYASGYENIPGEEQIGSDILHSACTYLAGNE